MASINNIGFVQNLHLGKGGQAAGFSSPRLQVGQLEGWGLESDEGVFIPMSDSWYLWLAGLW